VNYLLNDPQSVEALGLERGIPLNKAAEAQLMEKGVIDPQDPVIAGLRQAQALHTTVVATPYIEDLQVIDRFTSAREKLEQGQTPAQVAADFRQQVERIVRRVNR
ncbi:MAG: carbohydrate ABC transporter substrate-binding protein, partial [Leclercia adecarboxylata]|nr:carbohydrate ABC transporter substrate-binding protein [Leclercia adecarboxylata]